MTDNRPASDIDDERVSQAYHALAVEESPASVDRQILDAARMTNTGPGSGRRFERWLRPVTVAATIGLSLAVILEFSETTEGPVYGVTPTEESAALPSNVFEEAGNQAAAEIERLGTGMSSSSSTSVQEPSQVSGPRVDESTRLPDDAGCEADQRATPSLWWACIEDLEQRGLTSVAEQELQALLRTYPGITRPE